MTDRDLARQAYAGISFTPERRGDSDLQEMQNEIAAFRADLEPLARNDAQKEILANECAFYAGSLRDRYRKLWAAKSRTISPMITGPANFPVRRNNKRMETERRRLEELCELPGRARAAARKRILAARTPAEEMEDEWLLLRRKIRSNLETVAAIDSGELPYYRSAFTNSIKGRLDRMAGHGQIELVRRALEYIKTNQNPKRPFFAARNGVWKLVETAKAEAAKPVQTGEETIAEKNGVTIINNHDEERVQIFFPGKPDAETRARLKGRGFRFSRRNGNAWQRKNTANGIFAAKQFLEEG